MEYLETSYKVDSGMLKETIRKETVVRKTVPISTILDSSDLELDIENLIDDLVVNMGLDPMEARRSAMHLAKVTKTIPEIDMEFSWSQDQLKRIDKSKIPVGQRVAKGTGYAFPPIEDAMFLARTLTGTVGDIEAICVTGNHTNATTHLDLGTYAEMKQTLAGLIGQLISGIGNIKPYALYLYVTPDVYNRLLGLGNDTSDRSGVEYVNATLKESGSSASMIVVTENLGCTLTKNKAGVKISALTTANATLTASDGKFYNIFASPFDHRIRPMNGVDGYYSKVIERWMPIVHEIKAIIDDNAVVMS